VKTVVVAIRAAAIGNDDFMTGSRSELRLIH
jgi:hypothetical protein